MAELEGKPALATTTTVFDQGKLPFTSKKVETSNGDDSTSSPPPKPLLIVTPTTSGQYPVILFLHGFYLRIDLLLLSTPSTYFLAWLYCCCSSGISTPNYLLYMDLYHFLYLSFLFVLF